MSAVVEKRNVRTTAKLMIYSALDQLQLTTSLCVTGNPASIGYTSAN